MRLFIAILILTLCFATVVLAGSPAQLMGSVEAVYHEGVMSFRVDHADAISISIKVYDLETDALVYDSGPRERTLVTWPAGHDVTGSFRYVVTAWNAEGEVVVSQAAVTKNFTPIADITFDTIPGNTKLLGPTEVIVETDLQVGATQGFRADATYSGQGGGWYAYEENGGTTHSYLQPDIDGEGGFFFVDGSVASGSYTRIQGMGVANQAELYVQGTSDFGVYAGLMGNGSVVLPGNAVYDAEILDEPGVAADVVPGTTGALTTSPTNVMIRTISVPSSGYVWVTSAITFYLNHTNGSPTRAYCSISTVSATQQGDPMYSQISHAGPTGGYAVPQTLSRIISVTAGSHQLYTVCQKGTGGIVNMWSRQMNEMFVPTSYGTIGEAGSGESAMLPGHAEWSEFDDGPSVPSESVQPMTADEMAAERLASIQANLDRIQAEVAEIAATNAALAAEGDPNMQ